MKNRLAVGLFVLLLAACTAQEAPADNIAGAEPSGLPSMSPDVETVPPSETAATTEAWIGRWTGVEGLALDIEPGAAPGKFSLQVTLMDGSARYDGTADGETIHFIRDGKPQTIRAVAGNETGLKWLAEKKDCLMIEQGEGFCRD